MNVLTPIRKRLAERAYYGRATSEEYITSQLDRWNTAPPTRTRFCSRCAGEVRWYREGASFSVATGKAGHSYHLKCPHASDIFYESEQHPGQSPQLTVLYSGMHYDSHQYRWREGDHESFDQEDLW